MTWLLTHVLGVRQLDPSDPSVHFRFGLDMPLWAWVLALLLAACAAAWGYWRLAGSLRARTALGLIRWGLLALVLVVVADPKLVREREFVEKDWVVFLADRSRSMEVQDVQVDPGTRESRDAQLRRSLGAAAPALSQIAQERRSLWLGFDAAAFDLQSQSDGTPQLGAATGPRTDVNAAMTRALQRVAARPVSAIVVLSDGKFAAPLSRAILQRLASDQIPVFTVPLGGGEAMPDASIASVRAPSQAYLNDSVPVNVELASTVEGATIRGKLQLLDEKTGVVLDEQPIDGAASGSTVSLSSRPDQAGRHTWKVQFVPDGPDLSEQNNASSFAIDLVDRSIRVVYFDGYPRWEYRYLRGLLLREPSIKSSALLLSPTKRFLQEGTEALASIPSSPGEWAGVDVIMIGDVRSELFGTEQLAQIREHVARSGAGLLWIGGTGATPWSWAGTPLADLLPFVVSNDAGGGGVRLANEAVVVTPTPAAATLGVLRLGEQGGASWPGALSQAGAGWSQLWGTQWIDRAALKPTTEVLATAQSAGGAEGRPLVMTMRYGAGRVVYVATDETWRWRYGRGEVLYERFWLPLLRMLARESLGGSGIGASLEVSPERVAIGQPAQVRLRVVDESIARNLPARLTLRVTPVTESQGGDNRAPAVPTELTMLPESGVPGRSSSFEATWTPTDAGEYRLEVADAALAIAAGGSPPSTRAVALLPDDELRSPQADHAALIRLSEQTGGAVLKPEQLDQLAQLLPKRELRTLGSPETETLWDRPAVLIGIMLLLVTEWLGRKWLRLA